MLNAELESLMPGDVLLIKYSDTYWHTMMIVSNGRLAHAPGPGQPCITERIADFASETMNDPQRNWSLGQLKQTLHAFRFTGDPTFPSWSTFAEQWCQANPQGLITRYAAEPTGDQKKQAEWYNYPRYRGVLKGADDGHNAQALPFGPDALFRAIKWAHRHHWRLPFSQTRGTTCCAFVMACIQAAFVNQAIYTEQKTRLDELRKRIGEGATEKRWVDEIKDEVTTQVEKAVQIPAMRGAPTHAKGMPSAGAALRANSNRGLGEAFYGRMNQGRPRADRPTPYPEADLAQAVWAYFVEKGFVDASWDELALPAALRHDAKYMYSRTFHHVLAADDAWRAL